MAKRSARARAFLVAARSLVRIAVGLADLGETPADDISGDDESVTPSSSYEGLSLPRKVVRKRDKCGNEVGSRESPSVRAHARHTCHRQHCDHPRPLNAMARCEHETIAALDRQELPSPHRNILDAVDGGALAEESDDLVAR